MKNYGRQAKDQTIKSVSLRTETVKKTEALAKEAGISFSAFVNQALLEHLGEPDVLQFPTPCLGSVAAGNKSMDCEESTVMLSQPLKKGHYLLRVNGASMEPDIPDGSLIKVQEFKGKGYPRKGAIVVYSDGTGSTLKKFSTRKDADGNREGILTSVNPDYPAVEPMDGGEIQAVFVKIIEQPEK